MYWHSKTTTIIINRTDIEQLLRVRKPVRDQLIHLLAAKMGLRTGEIANARIENLDLAKGHLYITDSKNKELYPIPVSWEIGNLAEQVIGDRTEGWLIHRRHMANHGSRKGKSLTDTQIWLIVRNYAIKSGIATWQQVSPRLLRHYFAATFAKGKDGRPGNLEVLRRILRHKSLAHTQIYLSRLIFFEDLKEEYDRIHDVPHIEEQGSNPGATSIVSSSPVKVYKRPLEQTHFFQDNCSECEHRLVCRFMEEGCRSEWATSCRFKTVTATCIQRNTV